MILAARSASSQLIAWLQKVGHGTPHSCGGQLITRALAAPTRPGAPQRAARSCDFSAQCTCRSMMVSTSFNALRSAFLGVDAFPRRRENGTARGRRERHCPSCACSSLALGRLPRSQREQRAPHRGLRPVLHPRARERRPGRLDALVHRVSLASRIALGDSARAVCSWQPPHLQPVTKNAPAASAEVSAGHYTLRDRLRTLCPC